MPDNKKKSKPAEKSARKRGKTTVELRERHLKDKNDKITDEDIRELDLNPNVDTTRALKFPKGEERPHDVDKDHAKSTPWDVLGE